ncbi:plantaricin C family lantibiotic [Rothia dentocariosa]
MLKDVTLLEELAEQDLAQVNGGTGILEGVIYTVVSHAVGNQGAFCTVTKECQGGDCKLPS